MPKLVPEQVRKHVVNHTPVRRPTEDAALEDIEIEEIVAALQETATPLDLLLVYAFYFCPRITNVELADALGVGRAAISTRIERVIERTKQYVC